MRFALSICGAVAFVACVVAAMSAQSALADSAFITQAAKSSFVGQPSISFPVNVQSFASFVPPSRGPTAPTPETTVPATGGNFAGTLEMGQFNRVFQGQSGFGNVSNVGIIKGMHDNVDVLQHGHGLVSNLWLVNTQGLSVDVIQPPGSAPVNMLIARLPNGSLLIRR
jgi:hypothetical protein